MNGRDAEVVPLTAVEIENDGAEADDFRDRPRDQREDGRKVALRTHELGDADERSDSHKVAWPAPRPREQARQSRASSPMSLSGHPLAADRTALL